MDGMRERSALHDDDDGDSIMMMKNPGCVHPTTYGQVAPHAHALINDDDESSSCARSMTIHQLIDISSDAS